MKRALGVAILAIGLLAGCAGKVAAPEQEASIAGTTPATQVPLPDTPIHLVQRVAGHWNRLDWRGYANLLTEDFQFVFAQADSAGNAYRERPFERYLEILAVRHMFETGNATLPPLRRVVMTLERNLTATPDPRPGKTFPAHQVVRTSFSLAAEAEGYSFRIAGFASFYVVRGDSAAIPPELRDRGVNPDPSRWWLERWEDETLDFPATPRDAAMPSRTLTLGGLKVRYL